MWMSGTFRGAGVISAAVPSVSPHHEHHCHAADGQRREQQHRAAGNADDWQDQNCDGDDAKSDGDALSCERHEQPPFS